MNIFCGKWTSVWELLFFLSQTAPHTFQCGETHQNDDDGTKKMWMMCTFGPSWRELASVTNLPLLLDEKGQKMSSLNRYWILWGVVLNATFSWTSRNLSNNIFSSWWFSQPLWHHARIDIKYLVVVYKSEKSQKFPNF